MHHFIQAEIQKLSALLLQIQNDLPLLKIVDAIANCSVKAIRLGKKILFAGNGGSAADAQHLAAELVCRLGYDRPAIPAIALTTDTSAMTAISNDHGFQTLFARQIEALGQSGDIFVGISTSGKSPNILLALEKARAKGLLTVGFTGAVAPLMSERCDFVINVPCKETPKIQECHIMLGHIICEVVEDQLYGAAYNPQRNSEILSASAHAKGV